MVETTVPDASRTEDGTLKIKFEWDGRHIMATVAADQKAGSKLRVSVPARKKAQSGEADERLGQQATLVSHTPSPIPPNPNPKLSNRSQHTG